MAKKTTEPWKIFMEDIHCKVLLSIILMFLAIPEDSQREPGTLSRKALICAFLMTMRTLGLCHTSGIFSSNIRNPTMQQVR